VEKADLESRIRRVEELCASIQSDPSSQTHRLGQEIGELAAQVDGTFRDLTAPDRLATTVGRGVLLEDVLNDVYDGFREVLPYDRIGFAMIVGDAVTARWARSDQDDVGIKAGYSLPLSETSLGEMLADGEPRIINDLVAYASEHSNSESTRLLIEEGVRSSLTCPLLIEGSPVGFLFFSSNETGAYSDIHTRTFVRIADQLAGAIEKGRLTSELAERVDAIEGQNRELLRLNDVKNTFIGMASHDLRSPLATIQMTADLLDAADHLSPDERKMFIRDIKQQAGYMLSLVNELLDVAQIESGKLDLELELVELDALIGAAVTRHGYLAAAKEIVVDHSGSTGTLVQADRTRLRQVIDNLLSNAVKYSPFGSTVSVSVGIEGDRAKVTVDDEGPGVIEQDRSRLFEYFETAQAQPTGGESSTGLGLAIARRIIDAHHGSIGVGDAPGSGSRFWFELPLASRIG
jgi:signal transduction histidine kinase